MCNAAIAHNGHGDELPWLACVEHVKNAPCEYSNSHGDLYRGHCKLFSGALMCIRNKPIIRAGDARLKPFNQSIDDYATAPSETPLK